MGQKERLADEFLTNKGMTLGEKGFQTDTQLVETLPNSNIVFYHFTKEDKLESIFSNGLYSYRPVACPKPPQEFEHCYLVEGFLEPFPKWLKQNIYFGNLGIESVQNYIGNVLLRIEVPFDYPGIYIADYAHVIECKYWRITGKQPLGLGYHCQNGYEATQAYVNSYIPIKDYIGGHLAPVVQVLRRNRGITIPDRYISISSIQPLT
ncbi:MULTISPECIES: hypothetical protein [Bacillus]|nr:MULTISPECIES: hypothetical protein [Bacillus]MBP1080815.1 hypothetical protein [Bacillus capparidis]MED1097459.1 hypothetical protein [Bacillus capparidis]